MGTDIHGIFQAQSAGTWKDIPNNLELERNYFLFGILAGVRREEDPISPPRGLPADFILLDCEDHPLTKLEFSDPFRRKFLERDTYSGLWRYWMGDHSFSWLLGGEILSWYEKNPKETWGTFHKDTPEKFFKEVERLQKKHGEIRFVFGFDS